MPIRPEIEYYDVAFIDLVADVRQTLPLFIPESCIFSFPGHSSPQIQIEPCLRLILQFPYVGHFGEIQVRYVRPRLTALWLFSPQPLPFVRNPLHQSDDVKVMTNELATKGGWEAINALGEAHRAATQPEYDRRCELYKSTVEYLVDALNARHASLKAAESTYLQIPELRSTEDEQPVKEFVLDEPPVPKYIPKKFAKQQEYRAIYQETLRMIGEGKSHYFIDDHFKNIDERTHRRAMQWGRWDEWKQKNNT